MGNRHRDAKPVAKLLLHVIFPNPGTSTIASAAIGKNHEFCSVWIAHPPFLLPPARHTIYGKLRSIAGSPHNDRALVRQEIVDSVGSRPAFRHGGKIVIVDFCRCFTPGSSLVFESADQLFFLRVNADDRDFLFSTLLSKACNILELLVSIRFGTVRFFLVVEPQREIEALQQPSDRVGADVDSR